MNATDAFFTQTIVGAPFSVPLGGRFQPGQTLKNGLQIEFGTSQSRLSQTWSDWWVLSHAGDAPGLPRIRPSRVRRWLERHALWLAMLGLVSLAAATVAWGIVFWR